MLGQLITSEKLVDPVALDQYHYDSDLRILVFMEKQKNEGKLFVENLEDKAGISQKQRIRDILNLGDNHIIILNWCVSLLTLNEYTIPSLLENPDASCSAYFGPLSKVQKNWIEYLDIK